LPVFRFVGLILKTNDMLNEKKFRAIYSEFLESGLTIRDYCANQQMNEAKFYYWQNKLKEQLSPKRGFVPVVFENGQQVSQVPSPVQNLSESSSHPAASNKTISCEISYPNGVLIKLNGLPDAQMLRSLLVLTRR
jgi:hypothetical protein